MRSGLDQKGMTLIEIMLVVAILGGITALVATNLVGSRKKANIQLTKTQVSNLMNALDQYHLDNNVYPATEQGLEALVEEPTSGKVPKNYQEGGYIKKVPKDSWGNEFVYYSPGMHGNDVELISMGPDEEEGTDDDIESWSMDEEGGGEEP